MPKRNKGGVCIGFAHPDEVSSYFLRSLMSVMREDNYREQILRHRYIAVRSGPLIDKARNEIVRHFLEHPDHPEWLLMVDADMEFTYQDLLAVYDAASVDEKPIVGGLCFAGNHKDMFPTLYQITKHEDDTHHINRVVDYPRDALCKVDGTGAAFLLIHREVFKLMKDLQDSDKEYEHPAPWFANTYLGPMPFGEDITFCIRAHQLGLPIYVNTAAKIKHWKVRPLDETYYDEVRDGSHPE